MTRNSSGARTNRRELDQFAYEKIKKMILSCELAPGESIIEQNLSDKLEISRTPIRVALKKLEAENLVETYSCKGAFVTRVSPRDAEEIFEFRILLELESLKNYVALVPDTQLDSLIAEFADYKNMEHFSPKYHELDERFHSDIIRFSCNSRIMATSAQLHAQQERYRRIAAMDPNRVLSTAGEHIHILEMIKTRRYDTAARALETHLLSVKNSVLLSFRTYYQNGGVLRGDDYAENSK